MTEQTMPTDYDRRSDELWASVDDYDEDWTRLQWVLVRGDATIVDDPALHAAALARLRIRYPQYRAMALDDVAAHPVVRIVPRSVRSWRASDRG